MQLRKTHIATMVVGIAVITGAVLTLNEQRNNSSVSADRPVGDARLIMQNQTLRVGTEGFMDIKLSTHGGETSGVDLVLQYDPTLIEIIDADPTIAGTQIVPAQFFDFVQANGVDTRRGVIRYSAGQQPTNLPVAADNQTIATVRFKAKDAGTSAFSFDFVAGSLSDTNVIKADEGRDLLVDVVNAQITVNE